MSSRVESNRLYTFSLFAYDTVHAVTQNVSLAAVCGHSVGVCVNNNNTSGGNRRHLFLFSFAVSASLYRHPIDARKLRRFVSVFGTRIQGTLVTFMSKPPNLLSWTHGSSQNRMYLNAYEDMIVERLRCGMT